jgi:hypothetical protein
MASRLELHEILCEILNNRNVYFQPPESVKLKYPCIVYSKSEPDTHNANNKLYIKTNKYDGVVIDYDPDSEIPDKIITYFPMSGLGKGYVKDNLNHTPFNLFF